MGYWIWHFTQGWGGIAHVSGEGGGVGWQGGVPDENARVGESRKKVKVNSGRGVGLLRRTGTFFQGFQYSVTATASPGGRGLSVNLHRSRIMRRL